MAKTAFDELFIATLGMFSFSIDQITQDKVEPELIKAQFEHVLEARNQCEQIFTERGPKTKTFIG